jgi:hypothetical protein
LRRAHFSEIYTTARLPSNVSCPHAFTQRKPPHPPSHFRTKIGPSNTASFGAKCPQHLVGSSAPTKGNYRVKDCSTNERTGHRIGQWRLRTKGSSRSDPYEQAKHDEHKFWAVKKSVITGMSSGGESGMTEKGGANGTPGSMLKTTTGPTGPASTLIHQRSKLGNQTPAQ